MLKCQTPTKLRDVMNGPCSALLGGGGGEKTYLHI